MDNSYNSNNNQRQLHRSSHDNRQKYHHDWRVNSNNNNSYTYRTNDDKNQRTSHNERQHYDQHHSIRQRRRRSRDTNEEMIIWANPMIINKKITGCQNLQELIRLLSDDRLIVRMNEINVSTLIHRLGKFLHGSRPQVVGEINQLVQKIVNKAMQFNFDARGTSNVIYGIGNGRLDQLITNNSCDLLLIKLIEQAIFSQFRPQELANSVWSFATMKIYNEKLMMNISQQCIICQFANLNRKKLLTCYGHLQH
jgi:hypothetical protein